MVKNKKIVYLKQLLDKVRDICKSNENLRRAEMWDGSMDNAYSYWRGKSKSPSKNQGKVSFILEPEIPMWCSLLEDIDLEDYFNSPEDHLIFQLEKKILHFNYFKDDEVTDKSISINMGYIFEPSFFGKKSLFLSGREPITMAEPVIKDKKDLNKLKFPDFYNSGLMPKAHKFFEEINNLLKKEEDFILNFSNWSIGLWGLATQLRGMEQLAIDLIDDPGFIRNLLEFLTNSCMQWVKARSNFLNEPISKGEFSNDEINDLMLSPSKYEEFVQPYEIELSKFFGGIFYWHSCGNITNLLKKIQQIPDIDIINISAYTDLKKSVETIKKGISLEVCLHPLKDVYMASNIIIKNNLENIIEVCKDIPYSVRAEGFFIINNVKVDKLKLKNWCNIAGEILHKNIN